jgi:hypothetical protein
MGAYDSEGEDIDMRVEWFVFGMPLFGVCSAWVGFLCGRAWQVRVQQRDEMCGFCMCSPCECELEL